MSDVFTKAKRSEVMSRIRGRGNKETELALAKLLRAARITGWRRHALVKFKVQGSGFNVQGSARLEFRVRPDFVFPKLRAAVFVDGCFWHGCPKHSSLPANHRAFWLKKLTGNQGRDRRVTRVLRQSGWRVLRIWEHELTRKNQARCVGRVQRFLGIEEPFSSCIRRGCLSER